MTDIQKQNTYTGIIVIYCYCLSCLLFFCIDIFTDCHLDLTVYVCLFHCLKYDSHLVE